MVEVLTLDGCPHAEPAVALAGRVLAETGIDAVIRVLSVVDSDTEKCRFLGSPSIRVDGRDVEPGADLREDYAHCCRLYTTAAGRGALPDATWLRDALIRSQLGNPS
jgi:hypothetical protein